MPSFEQHPNHFAMDENQHHSVPPHVFSGYDMLPMSSTLSVEQRVVLIELIQETHGAMLPKNEFEDALLLLLEDVSGFEHPVSEDLSLLIADLCGRYPSALGAGR